MNQDGTALNPSSNMNNPEFSSIRRAYIGNLGSGKTAAQVLSSLKCLKKKGKKIYSNVKMEALSSRQYEPLVEVGMIFDLAETMQRCFLGLDEITSLASGRKSFSTLNEVIVTLCMLSRKADWQVEYTEQYVTMVDIWIRAITDDVVEPRVVRGFIVEKHYYPDPYQYFFGRKYCASQLYDWYDHKAPPLTLDMKELKYRWKKFQKDRNIKRGVIGWQKGF
jgi:hypothetical protein